MKKLLITGGSGYLGWHCCLNEQHGWKVIATHHHNKDGVHPSADAYKLDLTDKDALWKALKTVKPDAVFHLAAHSGTGFCENNPEESHQLNVAATTHLAEMAADLKAKLFFTSSEQVFDGTQGQYTETDEPNPKNEYGKQKLEAENIIQSVYPEACILRIAVLFGLPTTVSKSFLNQWTESWEKMIPITAFHDEIRPFLSAKNCTDGLFHLLHQGAQGLFHLGGKTFSSRYDFALMAKNILNFPDAIIYSKSQKEVETPAYRPPDLSLNCQKIAGTGFELKMPQDELKKLKPFFRSGDKAMLN